MSSTKKEKIRLILVRSNHSDGRLHEPERLHESQFVSYNQTSFLSWPNSVKICYFSLFDYGDVGDH